MKRAVCVWLAAMAALLPAGGVRASACDAPAGAVPVMEEEWEEARLTERDRAYLAAMIAANYGGEDYAAQTGIAAVVLRRVRGPGWPDSAAGVIAAFAREGEFLRPVTGHESARELRIAGDAVRDAARGMDPTGGAACFRSVQDAEGFDLRFDDLREDASARSADRLLADCRVVCGRVGFW